MGSVHFPFYHGIKQHRIQVFFYRRRKRAALLLTFCKNSGKGEKQVAGIGKVWYNKIMKEMAGEQCEKAGAEPADHILEYEV